MTLMHKRFDMLAANANRKSAFVSIRLLRLFAYLLFLVTPLFPRSANAANIFAASSHEFPLPLINISGEIQAGDSEHFLTIAQQYPQALVNLNSPGGNAMAGIQIARIIRMRNYSTVVMDGNTCASACAIIWVAGTPRYFDGTAQIGFHAVYRVQNGVAQESGAGNAVLGSFFGAIGLSDAAIVYFTQSAPDSITWLHQAQADQLGLNIQNISRIRTRDTVSGGIARNDADVIARLLQKAAQGDADAQYSLGLMCVNGQGVARNDAEAVKWFRMAAAQGDAYSQTNLGLMYANGQGVARNDAEAVKWFRMAADQGLAESQSNLGVMYAQGRGVARNEAEAVKWYRMAANQGNAGGQYNLGAMFAQGLGVARNDAEAVKWLRMAADQGDAKAQNALGVMYSKGRGVVPNDAEAAKWYRMAADQGVADAQYSLGFMYENGRGVAPNAAEAAKWYRMAANQGDGRGQTKLGLMYMIAARGDEAAKWFRMAADQGYASAQYSLGLLYANGLGVTRNDAEAAKWFRMAADQGNENARNALRALSSQQY